MLLTKWRIIDSVNFCQNWQNFMSELLFKSTKNEGNRQKTVMSYWYFFHSAHPSETVFCIVIVENLRHFCWRIFSKPRFLNWTQTKLVLSPIRCALSWADTKMSYQYFLFIYLCYVKPKSISEKFETNFVKQFLPWNPTPCTLISLINVKSRLPI